MHYLNKRNFLIAVTLSFVLACILIYFSYHFGKVNFFLLLNTNLGIFADYFFGIFTNAGDFLMWLFVFLITIFLLKRKNTWPLLLLSLVISTIITQVFKYFIVPDEPRPWLAIKDHSTVHHAWFVQPFLVSSFPSGHTAAAFTFYFLFCLLITKNWWLYVGSLFAVTVAYSRVYLAQHFPFDLAGGIIVAIISVSISIFIQQQIWKKQNSF